MRWFRFYDDAINDPKILKLSDELRWVWVCVLCIASKNNGELPAMSDVALLLRMKPHKAGEAIIKLIQAGLVDEVGSTFVPHNWGGRQYKSDVSTERVKRFRNGKGNVSETPPDNREQNTESESKKELRPVAAATRTTYTAEFEAFWKPYPRTVNMSKAEAFAVWKKISPEAREAATRAVPLYAEWLRSKPNHEVIHACRFLSKNRAEGFVAPPEPTETPAMDGKVYVKFTATDQLEAWDAYGKATRGKGYPRDRAGGWLHDSEWPPGHVAQPVAA